MYCSKCGTELPKEANFCWKCGQPQTHAANAPPSAVQYELCTVRKTTVRLGTSLRWEVWVSNTKIAQSSPFMDY
ncbi:MAG: zinc ribbon domain-containing protein [Anaerolineae bacterium]|nr:zinc ribbon domain-containing protein [Anaerolineae bacterium]